MNPSDHEGQLQDYRCPACSKAIRPLRAIDPIVPSTWNDCCSPECGDRFDGYLDAVGEECYGDPKVQQWYWNQWQAWYLIYLKQEIQDACEHDWQVNGGYAETLSIGGQRPRDSRTQRFQLLMCSKCNAAKHGEPIGAEMGMTERLKQPWMVEETTP